MADAYAFTDIRHDDLVFKAGQKVVVGDDGIPIDVAKELAANGAIVSYDRNAVDEVVEIDIEDEDEDDEEESEE